MKQRMYMLSREMPHPTAKGQMTRVFFIGWVPVEVNGPTASGRTELRPMWGPPHEDGCRNAIMFPNQSLVQQVIEDLPLEFKRHLKVVDAVIEEV